MSPNLDRLNRQLSNWSKLPDSAEVEVVLADLRAQSDILRGMIRAQDMDLIDNPEWASSLTSQQREFMGMLIGAHPKAVCRWDVLERLSGRDHVIERELHAVTELVRKIRERLGKDSIETVHGGYRLGQAFRMNAMQAA